MITLAIAEDHQSLIDGLELLLKYDDYISIIGVCNDGEALLDIVQLKQPKVVLTDIKMPKIDGVSATKLIKKNYPHIKVIAFTMFDQDEAVKQMINAGAEGYILKSSSLQDVIKAIETVFKGGTFYDSNITTNLTISTESSKQNTLLTKRQLEILNLIAQGKTSREIAEELFIGVYTVDTHRKNMIKILGLKGKGELMRYALDKKYDF